MTSSLTLLYGCGSQPVTPPTDISNPITDLQVVDCLLPGQVRRLGKNTYLTPRRPTMTTAADCRIRGGEYVAYDRSDYKTALNVWLETAKDGDAEAQTNVGEIFERGLGGTPNYEAAVIWYEKAAAQNNARALFNLGTLYEQGLGVAKNKLKAMNLYRQAWGIPEDNLIFQSAAREEQNKQRQRLEKDIQSKQGRIDLLNTQLSSYEKKFKELDRLEKNAGKANAELVERLKQNREEITSLRSWINQLEEEQQIAKVEITKLPVFREPKAIERQSSRSIAPLKSENIQFGRYYALVIGNQNYNSLDPLYSPIGDAQKVASLLRDKYGFSVQTLIDASNIEVMQAFNDLNDVLKESDNLLVFYAGHGTRLQSGEYESGYWLPVNADPPPTDTFWVSNEFITRHLGRLKAKRVLIVADSCYAGLLSTAPGFLFMGNDQPYTEDYIKYKLPKKSRLLLSSGGDQPVLDNAGSGHSVFAKAFLDELESNSKILAGPELFVRIRDRVSRQANIMGVEQEPEFKAVKGAGHEVGDFFFVPENPS